MTRRPLAPIHEMRVVSWSYPPGIAPPDARRAARRFTRQGANTVITEDNRYLLYNPPPGAPAPHFHFVPTPRSRTLPATRIVVQAMHAEGIRVIHHVTLCYASRDFMEQHRDWTQRDARNPSEPLFFGDYGGVWLFCLNNPDFRGEFISTAAAFTRETGVDGWMIDETEFLPDWFSCGCVHCRAAFRRDTGFELPAGHESPVWGNFGDPVWRAWIAWRMTGPARFFADVRTMLDSEFSDKILTACHAGLADTWSAQYWACDEVAWSPHLNLVFYEAFVRDSIPFHSWPRFVAELEAYSVCARATPNPPLALFYPRSRREALFCWALATSRGHRLWGYVPHGATKPLVRLGAATSSPGFRWQAAREQVFRPAEPLARIALLFSKPSRDMVSPLDNSYYIDEWAGWATAMAEAVIPFRVILDRDLAAGRLDGVALLVMPNAVCLSDAEMAAALRFRAVGNKVIATADTAARDETGTGRHVSARRDFLAKLDIFVPEALGRAAFRGYARKGQQPPAPADHAARERITQLLRTFPEAAAWRASAPGDVSVNVMRRNDGSLAVHLLNTTGALRASGPGRGTPLGTRPSIPRRRIRNIQVEMECPACPAGQPVIHHFGRAAAAPCPFEWNNATLRLFVPEIGDYAVIDVPAPGNSVSP
ncbi:MAG: alpha-amylase family protein [bacterium]